MSNIGNYGRVQLLVEMLLRLYRILKEEEKERFKGKLRDYTKQTSGQYIYQLERAEIPQELEKIGELYQKLHSGILQSPDDLDATYRKKDKKTGKGQSVNVTATTNPENELNLLTDMADYPYTDSAKRTEK